MSAPERASAGRDDPVEAAASEWLARCEEGLSPGEEAELARWRLADPRHEAALVRLEGTWAALRRLRELPEARLEPDPDRLGPRADLRRQNSWLRDWGMVAAAMFLALAAWWALHPAPPGPELRAYVTLAGDVRRIALNDGSVTFLNADSELDVSYTAAERRVRLVRGEANFQVAKNPGRPFCVEAGRIEVRDLGTAFDVRIVGREVDVLVTEGRVRLSPGGPEVLVAGQRAAAIEGTPVRVETVAAERVGALLAWQDPPLQFAATPLVDAVAAFNQRNVVQIEVADSSLRTLPVSGSFRAENVEAFVRLLAQSGDILVNRPSPARIVLRKAQPD